MDETEWVSPKPSNEDEVTARTNVAAMPPTAGEYNFPAWQQWQQMNPMKAAVA
jgi:hypothetical protein